MRSLLKSLGISLRSATEPIDDTATGELMEGVLAAFAQFDNGHPDFPLRGFVRCESCGRGLTGSWSKGRTRYYASLDQRQRFQQLVFPEGMTFDRRDFVGTAVTTRAFNYLQPIEGAMKGWWT